MRASPQHFRGSLFSTLWRSILLGGSAWALVLTGAPRTVAAELLPATDNAAPPFMGIYDGPPWGGITATDDYMHWLNRTQVWGHGSNNWDDWRNIDRADFLYRPWSKWIAAGPGRRLVLSISLFPTGCTLEQGASRAYDSHYRTLAQHLLGNHLESSILRLGWEFNGSWYPWKVTSAEQAVQFVACWRRAVDAIRAVPGAEKLTFCWNGANEATSYPLEAAYPGDTYVDYVGTDVYDVSWAKDTYPYPPDASEAGRLANQQRAWDTWIYPVKPKNGIKAWQDIALAHHKPFVIPEWGLEAKGGHGGYDNPWFIERMHRLIHDPARPVYFASYWNARDSRIFHAGEASRYPRATETFLRLFALPKPAAQDAQQPLPATATGAAPGPRP